MKEALYKDMTNYEKIGLLHFIRGQQGLVQHANYEGLDKNPEQTPNVSNLYISSVLNFNFDKFYNSQLTFGLSKLYQKEWQVDAMDMGGSPSHFIGDALKDILYLMLDISLNRTIDKELMMDIDNAITKLYKTFHDVAYSLNSTKPAVPAETVQYVECVGMLYNGEKLYKRVK